MQKSGNFRKFYSMEKETKIEQFFRESLRTWERRNGRKPVTRDEMWEAVMDGMESLNGRPNN